MGERKTAYGENFHRIDIFLRGFGRFFVGIVKLTAFEVPIASVSQIMPTRKRVTQMANSLGSLIRTSPSIAHYGPHKLGIDLSSTNAFHHCEMFQIIMRLKQRITSVEFDQYAANAPDIAGEAPPEVEDDFGRPIVPGRYYRGVVFVIEGSRAEIDESNLSIEEYSSLTCIALISGR